MASKPIEGVVDEFTVAISKVDLISKKKGQIEDNFNVRVELGQVFSFQEQNKQWVNVHGHYNDRSSAKEYIKALCNPESNIAVPFPPELREIATNKTLITKLERKTKAVVSVQTEQCKLLIQGTDVSVTLALSIIEELISSHQQDMIDSHTSPNTYVRQASVRLEEEIQRIWSQDDGIDYADITKIPDPVKRAILSCFADDNKMLKTDIGHHMPSSYRYSDFDGTPELDIAAMNLNDKAKPNHDSRDHLFSLALENDYSEDDFNVVMAKFGDDTEPTDEMLLHELYEHEKSKNSAVQYSWHEHLPSPPAPEQMKDGQSKHLLNYFSQLSKDFVEEDSNCSLEELKRRNAERQKILHEALREKSNDGRTNEGSKKETKTPSQPAVQQGKKKKVKKSKNSSRFNDAALESYDQNRSENSTCPNELKTEFDQELLISPASFSLMNKALSTNSTPSKPSTSYIKGGVKGNDMKSKSNHASPASKQDRSHRQHLSTNARLARSRLQQQQPQLQQPTASPAVNQAASTYTTVLATSCVRLNQPDKTTADDKRYIVIDGSNVAMTHGNGTEFSCRGIEICVDYFVKRGHSKITAFVPNFRKGHHSQVNRDILEKLHEKGYVVFTPSRRVGGRLVACYDDRFIIRLADEMDGIIVSNDQYRDLMEEKEEWRKTIEEKLLQYSFVGDFFMPPDDPLGRDGPTLDEFLCKSTSKNYRTRTFSPMSPKRLFVNDQEMHDISNAHPRRPSPWRHRQNSPHGARNYDSTSSPYRTKKSDSRNSPFGSNNTGFRKTPDVYDQPRRPPEETEKLLHFLLNIFPEHLSIVKTILQNHPDETDVNKLSSYILNVM